MRFWIYGSIWLWSSKLFLLYYSFQLMEQWNNEIYISLYKMVCFLSFCKTFFFLLFAKISSRLFSVIQKTFSESLFSEYIFICFALRKRLLILGLILLNDLIWCFPKWYSKSEVSNSCILESCYFMLGLLQEPSAYRNNLHCLEKLVKSIWYMVRYCIGPL